MKNLLLIISITLLISCQSREHDQNDINKKIEEYVKTKLDNPESLQSVEFTQLKKTRSITSLDSMLDSNLFGSFDYQGIKHAIDSLSKERPDLADEYSNDLKKIESHKLDYYWVDYTFRIKSHNRLKLQKYYFELDTMMNITSYENISRELKIIN